MYDKTAPLNTDLVSAGDDDIRATKEAIEEAIQIEHDFPVVAGLPVARHKFPNGNSTSRPAGYNGRIYLNTEINAIEQYQGGWNTVASLIPKGSIMLFYQLAAPTGWTRLYSYDDRMLRLVNDDTAGDTGGSWVLPDIVVDDYTMEAHKHSVENFSTLDENISLHTNYDHSKQLGGSWAIWAINDKHGHILSLVPEAGTSNTFVIKDESVHGHTFTHNGSWRPKITSVIVAEKW